MFLKWRPYLGDRVSKKDLCANAGFGMKLLKNYLPNAYCIFSSHRLKIGDFVFVVRNVTLTISQRFSSPLLFLGLSFFCASILMCILLPLFCIPSSLVLAYRSHPLTIFYPKSNYTMSPIEKSKV